MFFKFFVFHFFCVAFNFSSFSSVPLQFKIEREKKDPFSLHADTQCVLSFVYCFHFIFKFWIKIQILVVWQQKFHQEKCHTKLTKKCKVKNGSHPASNPNYVAHTKKLYNFNQHVRKKKENPADEIKMNMKENSTQPECMRTHNN